MEPATGTSSHNRLFQVSTAASEQFAAGAEESLRSPTASMTPARLRTASQNQVDRIIAAGELATDILQYPDIRRQMGLHGGPIVDLNQLRDIRTVERAPKTFLERIPFRTAAGREIQRATDLRQQRILAVQNSPIQDRARRFYRPRRNTRDG